MSDAADLMQSDLRELLLALDMGDHARPQSPHEVFQVALTKVRHLREQLEDKTASLRVEIAAKQGAHNEIRIMEMAIRRAARALDEGQVVHPYSQVHYDLLDALPDPA